MMHASDAGSYSRRGFLYGAGLTAGATILTACTSRGSPSDSKGSEGSKGGTSAKGSASKPMSPPKSFQEAPTLAKQVKKGKLPKVAKRLPKKPYVIPHRWVENGKYGGTLNMVALSSSGTSSAHANRQYFYGFSPLRFLNDGKDVGPGTVEKWKSNDDASEWTLHFRDGLRWSDGKPFTVDDVLFWWDDVVRPGHFGQSPPDWGRSKSGKLLKMAKVDDLTLNISYDSPSPLFPQYIATWPNGGAGNNGPIWVLPKHYLKQFHPKYGTKIPKDWDTVGGVWEKKSDWMRNPDCPTLLGYRCKSFDNGKGVVLERNPYYWAVTKNGDQLPYIDEISFKTVQKEQIVKLQVQQGKVDFCHGRDNNISLSDVSTLNKDKEKAGVDILQWNSGSGTGSVFFLNYDYPDKELRQLFRNPKFRQAISYAIDRKGVQKQLYYGTGELTTGTLSPQMNEFDGSDGKKLYQKWRDSYVKHDPEEAKKLLSDLGLKDKDGDGYVELPSGKKLTVRLDYAADISDDQAHHDDRLVSDCKKVGLRMKRNPVSPQSFPDQWSNGKLMAHTNWEASIVNTILLDPLWMVPVDDRGWAPLEGKYYSLSGTKKAKKGLNHSDPWKSKPPRLKPEADGPVAKMVDFMEKAKVEPDDMKRKKTLWEIIKIHIKDGPFFTGYVANGADIMVVKKGLKNVPRKENLAQGGLVNPWTHPVPGAYDTETWFWEDPKDHS